MLSFLRRLLVTRSPKDQGNPRPRNSRLFDGSTLDNEMALSPVTKQWLVSLPAEVWPQQLGVQRPDLANRIALLWPDGGCETYFVELMLDDDVMGASAPPAYREELICLEAFYLQAKADGRLRQAEA